MCSMDVLYSVVVINVKSEGRKEGEARQKPGITWTLKATGQIAGGNLAHCVGGRSEFGGAEVTIAGVRLLSMSHIAQIRVHSAQMLPRTAVASFIHQSLPSIHRTRYEVIDSAKPTWNTDILPYRCGFPGSQRPGSTPYVHQLVETYTNHRFIVPSKGFDERTYGILGPRLDERSVKGSMYLRCTPRLFPHRVPEAAIRNHTLMAL